MLIITTFIVGFSSFCTSIFFLENFNDYVQLDGDVAHFINVTYNGISYNINDLLILSEGSLAIFIWQKFSEIQVILNLKYIYFGGILINIILFSLSVIIISKLFDFNKYNNERFRLLILLPNMFWLFTGLHVRDIFLVFVVVFQVFLLFKYEDSKRIILFLLFILLSPLYIFLRYEFIIFPFVAYGIFLFTGFKFYTRVLLFILFSFLFAYLFDFLNSYIKIIDAAQHYLEKSELNSNDGLGIKILKAPLFLKLILGPLYLIIFPFPFWNSLFIGSFYHFVKGLNAIFYIFYVFYIFIALFNNKLFLKNRLIFFTSLLLLLFLVSTSFSSMESRHFAVFQLFIMALYIITTKQPRLIGIPLKSIYVFGYSMLSLFYYCLKILL